MQVVIMNHITASILQVKKHFVATNSVVYLLSMQEAMAMMKNSTGRAGM